MKIKQIHMVVDLQYGSTGKGLLIGYLAKKLKLSQRGPQMRAIHSLMILAANLSIQC
jgi:adenylosuccinate synthase